MEEHEKRSQIDHERVIKLGLERQCGWNKSNEMKGACWLLNVPATCECISGTDLLRQFYVLTY